MSDKKRVNKGKISCDLLINPMKTKRYKTAKVIATTAANLRMPKTILWISVLVDLTQEKSILSLSCSHVNLSSCFIFYFPAFVTWSPMICK